MENMKLLILTSALFFGFSQAWAAHLFEGTFRSGDTTDKIDFNEATFKGTYNQKDLFWPYKNEDEKNFSFDVELYHRNQKGLNFKSTYDELMGGLHFYHNKKHKLSAKAGFYIIDENAYVQTRTSGAAEVELASLWGKKFNTIIFLKSGSAVKEIFQTGGSLRSLDQTAYGIDAKYTFWKDSLTARAVYKKNDLENDVTRNYVDTELMYSIMKFPHWIRAGIGYETFDYNKNSAAYWSPSDFYSWGPRLDLSYVFNEKFQVFLGGTYSWFEEDKTYTGNGYYMRTGGRYGAREDFNVELSYERNESIQNNSSWVSKAFILQLNCFL